MCDSGDGKCRYRPDLCSYLGRQERGVYRCRFAERRMIEEWLGLDMRRIAGAPPLPAPRQGSDTEKFMKPRISILDDAFVYRPSYATTVTKTWRRLSWRPSSRDEQK